MSIELEAGKDPSLSAVLARIRDAGLDIDLTELRMGYARKSSPLLGEIRVAMMVAVDIEHRAVEVAHMPLDDVDPITLDQQIVERVLEDELPVDDRSGVDDIRRAATAIVRALRGVNPEGNQA